MTIAPALDDNDALGHINAIVTKLAAEIAAGDVDADTHSRLAVAAGLAEAIRDLGGIYCVMIDGLKEAAKAD